MWESENRAPPFLTSAKDEVQWSASRPWRFTLGDTATGALFGRLFGPQSRSGRYGEEKNPFPLQGIQARLLGRPAGRLVSIPTDPSRLPTPFPFYSYVWKEKMKHGTFSAEFKRHPLPE
jgi:hypothetical protein